MKKIIIKLILIFWLCTPVFLSAESAEGITKFSGIKGGLIVTINKTSADFLSGLQINNRFKIQGLISKKDNMKKIRDQLYEKKKYGDITIKFLDNNNLPYIDNMVNLLIIEDHKSLDLKEIFRVITPDGVLLTKNRNGLKNTGFIVQDQKSKYGWIKCLKPRPENMDEWTHWLHSPDNNAVSQDSYKEIPRNLQWVQNPLWLKSHELNMSLSTMVSAKGRLFYIIDESAPGIANMPDRWFLVARDAFNGIQLWKKPIKEWGFKYWQKDLELARTAYRFAHPRQILRRLIAIDDKVYVTPGLYSPVSEMDAAAGKVLRVFPGTEKTFEILCYQDKLFLGINRSIGTENPESDIFIMSIDLKTGKSIWKSEKGYNGLRPILNLFPQYTDILLTAGKKAVFFVDKNAIIGMDMTTGKKIWTVKRPESKEKLFTERYSVLDNDLCNLTYNQSILFFSQHTKKKTTILMAIDELSGKIIWEKTVSTIAYYIPPDIFVTGGLVWALDLPKKSFIGLDPITGENQKTLDASLIMEGTHHNCYMNKATKNFILYGRNKGVEFFDLKNNNAKRVNWVKGVCRYGIMPANNMLYFPSHNCTCYMTSKLNGIAALSGFNPGDLAPSGSKALYKNQKYKNNLNELPALESDWPMYRHDIGRSGYLSSGPGDELELKWKVNLKGKIAPPVIARGKVFLAAIDEHKIICLNEKDGKLIWSYAADGRIDSPPTFFKGRILFGSRSGSVTCLDAESGSLIWQFKAAPAEYQILAFDQVESLWPVFGSVLVHNDKVFFTAGRATYFQSGLYIYSLDLKSGQVINSKKYKHDSSEQGEIQNSVNADILVSDGRQMHIRGLLLNMDTLETIEPGLGKHRVLNFKLFPDYNMITALGGFLDDTLYNGAFWTYDKISASLFCLDDEYIYGINIYKNNAIKSHKHHNFIPDEENCKLFAVKKGPTPKMNKKKGWSTGIPIRANAMVTGRNKLYIAGVEDRIGKKDPWEYFDGKKGSKLIIYSKKDGMKEQEIHLQSTPVFDGLAAASQSLYLSCKDGSILCFR